MDAKKTSKFKKITIWMIVANVIIMAGYDVLALTEGGVDATISRVLYHGASEWPIIAVAFGVLAGHLFWPQKPEKKTANITVKPDSCPHCGKDL